MSASAHSHRDRDTLERGIQLAHASRIGAVAAALVGRSVSTARSSRAIAWVRRGVNEFRASSAAERTRCAADRGGRRVGRTSPDGEAVAAIGGSDAEPDRSGAHRRRTCRSVFQLNEAQVRRRSCSQIM